MQQENNKRTSIADGEMRPEDDVAMVKYNMEFRSNTDDAWYTVGVLMEGETLRIKYYGFSDDDLDSVFELSDFQSLMDIDKFGERFRNITKQLQDNECDKIGQGTKICASYSFSNEEVRFYDAIVVRVDKKRHSKKQECSCTFLLRWLHGPNAEKETEAKIENICIIEPSHELDHVVASFLRMARERKSSISASSNDIRKLGFVERIKMKDTRFAKRSVVPRPADSHDDTTTESDDIDLQETKTKSMILVGNLDTQLCPSTVTEFLCRYTSLSVDELEVYVFPSLPSQIFTSGAIILDSENEFQLRNFLDNPNYIITSSTCRPWVVMQTVVGLDIIKETIGTLVSVSKKGTNGNRNDLKIVRLGSKEFEIAKELRDIFLEFINHQGRLHKSLKRKETEILDAKK